MKPSTVSKHAASIFKKKEKINATKNYKYPASVRYGTIAVLDDQRDAHCWILDPPAVDIDIPPKDLRLVKRLAYTAKLVSLIAPNATLPHAISGRIEQILARGTDGLDGEPLLRPNGRAYSAATYAKQYLARNKLYIDEFDIVSKVLVYGRKTPLLVGLRGDLVNLAIKQDFKSLLSLDFSPQELHTSKVDLTAYPAINGVDLPRFAEFNLGGSSGGLIIGHT